MYGSKSMANLLSGKVVKLQISLANLPNGKFN